MFCFGIRTFGSFSVILVTGLRQFVSLLTNAPDSELISRQEPCRILHVKYEHSTEPSWFSASPITLFLITKSISFQLLHLLPLMERRIRNLVQVGAAPRGSF